MFPHNLTLAETADVVARHNAELDANIFIQAERGPFTIFNYLIQFPGAFPDFTGDPVRDREVGIIRECRGLTFYTETGEIAARKFHKFFNLGQREETMIHVLDFSRAHVIMDKLDGSMITPALYNDVVEWHTKMGATDVAKPVLAHVASRPEYEEFARHAHMIGWTPMFEWCTRQQRIVIDYPVDQLVLTHMRNNQTGAYATREVVNHFGETLGIPTVKVYENTISDINEFVEHTRGLKNLEGYVVHFDGDMLIKLKADEYCMLHNTKEKLNFEKNVIAMVFDEGFDDMLPQLDEGDRIAVSRFLDDAMAGIAVAANFISEMASAMKAMITSDDPREARKQYAALVAGAVMPNDHAKGLLFKAFEKDDLVPDIIKIVLNNTGSATKVDFIRPLIGDINWSGYRGYVELDA